MKKKIIIISLFFIIITQCIFAVTAASSSTQQYAYPVNYPLGSGGSASVAVVCNINRTNKTISYNSWGAYTPSPISGYSISLNSRSYENVNNTIKVTCKFTVFNYNSYQSQSYTQTKTVTYGNVSDYHNFN